ncbi:sigma-54 interaction domain-containing protein [Syntrophus aciditrophicus]|uniref:Transcriptional regulator with sigma 54 interaction domain n=1 Tax=Syntrophus aciditrophicus (strain SB) TaxID=56780 RepID=Q2LWE8_SYNAS|nr:sigma-54-dependent Fis family transcriptional regulator [Syntrophus aciditrophicus]ABC78404.1 transcriptional regulator with sigma 54 interaction domain [Syntrophus aciditrophicus SB]OPY18078.1 MAG: Transcriptional regulatory protein ZraR [Syntrophus sp. PtaB.Bin075]
MSKQREKTAPRERDTILDSIADGVFSVDDRWRITSFNRAAEKITGVSREDAVGQRCKDVLKAEICDRGCLLKKTMETGKPVVNRTVYIVNAEGRRLPISISTALLRDEDDRIIGAVETFRDLSLEEQLRKKIEARYSFEDIISRNHRMHELFSILPDIANSTSTVLIEGESGTGKELVARAIHNLSTRKSRPFVAVNCGALPDTLLESELFGYKAGAFTDARKDKPGRFKLAEKGTLFLDEIGDVSPAMQVRLLRVLQEKTYEPLGSVESVRHDVRIIAATNKKLPDLVREGKFREDLYYRINIVRLELPPLRERMEDIPLLVDHFIGHFNVLQNKEIAGVTDEALACLMTYTYPGNIRELENIIERAFILCKSGMIDRIHLPDPVCGISGAAEIPAWESMSFRDMEAIFLTNVLRRNAWNKSRTARELGIHKSTLFRKLKALGIRSPDKTQEKS